MSPVPVVRRRLGRVALALLPALAGLAPAVAAQERFTLAGRDAAIFNLAGRVSLERGSGSAIVVEVTRGGPDGARLRIEHGPLGGRSTLRVVYPGDEIGYPESAGETNLRVRDDGTFGDQGRGRQARRVRVARDGALEAWADLRVLVPAGMNLEVRLAAGAISARGVSADLRLDTHSAGIVAEAIRGRVLLDTGSGEVRATGIEGELTVDTGSGDVLVRDARTGALAIDTGSGGVVVEGVRTDALTVDTGSGDVRVGGSAERVEVDTGSGEVELDLGDGLRDVTVDTGSGDVTLLVPAAYGARVSLETSSGDLEVDIPLQLARRGQDALEGTIGDGRGTVRVDTGSGSITLRRR